MGDLCWPAMHSTSGTGFSREGGISDDKYRGDVLASSRLKPVPHGKRGRLWEILCWPAMRSTSGTGFSREGGISDDKYRGDVRASSRLKRNAARPVPHGTRSSVGDLCWPAMHSTSGTGFSREGRVSDDRYREDVLASSRLKPVPLGNSVFLIYRCSQPSAAPTELCAISRNSYRSRNASVRAFNTGFNK